MSPPSAHSTPPIAANNSDSHFPSDFDELFNQYDDFQLSFEVPNDTLSNIPNNISQDTSVQTTPDQIFDLSTVDPSLDTGSLASDPYWPDTQASGLLDQSPVDQVANQASLTDDVSSLDAQGLLTIPPIVLDSPKPLTSLDDFDAWMNEYFPEGLLEPTFTQKTANANGEADEILFRSTQLENPQEYSITAPAHTSANPSQLQIPQLYNSISAPVSPHSTRARLHFPINQPADSAVFSQRYGVPDNSIQATWQGYHISEANPLPVLETLEPTSRPSLPNYNDPAAYDSIINSLDLAEHNLSGFTNPHQEQLNYVPKTGTIYLVPPEKGCTYDKPAVPAGKPWIRTNKTTRGLNCRSEKINAFNPKAVYNLPPEIPSHPSFRYTPEGELAPGTEWGFNPWEIERYLREHPGHTRLSNNRFDGKKSTLCIRLQKAPADSARRNPTKASGCCRYFNCFAPGNLIKVGTLRLAFDELSARQLGTDPYINAGYVHLFCAEKNHDFINLVRDYNVQVDLRSFSMEKNHMKVSKHMAAVAQKFIDTCNENKVPEGYPRIPPYNSNNQPYAGTLCQLINAVKPNDDPPTRRRTAEARGNRSSQWHVHQGDLEVQFGKKAPEKRKRINEDNEDDGNRQKRRKGLTTVTSNTQQLQSQPSGTQRPQYPQPPPYNLRSRAVDEPQQPLHHISETGSLEGTHYSPPEKHSSGLCLPSMNDSPQQPSRRNVEDGSQMRPSETEIHHPQVQRNKGGLFLPTETILQRSQETEVESESQTQTKHTEIQEVQSLEYDVGDLIASMAEDLRSPQQPTVKSGPLVEDSSQSKKRKRSVEDIGDEEASNGSETGSLHPQHGIRRNPRRKRRLSESSKDSLFEED